MSHDPLFKELIRTFFVEFIHLFFPEVAAFLDPGSIEFVDKEVFTDLGAGKRHEVDLLVKARFRGRETFFLIHVEPQSTSIPEFRYRMFQYSILLHIKLRLPVYPIAVFSFDRPNRPEANTYTMEFPDFSPLRFEFRSIQLNRLNWRTYVRRPNPVAAALMTKMKIPPNDRPYVKLECLRMIATLKLDKARAALIGMFMEAYLNLTTEENAVYNRQLRTVAPRERKAMLKYTNPWIEEGKVKGLKQGLQKGRQEGRQEGRQDLILRQLRRRFKRVPVDLSNRVAALPDPRLAEFGEALLDFQTLADAETWIGCHT
jgi:hypothetical protein